MQRLLSLAAACLISGALAFAQGSPADQSATTSGAQQNSATTTANPSRNGAAASREGRAARHGSSSSQALPDNANGATAGANGQSPNGGQSSDATTPDANSATDTSATNPAPNTTTGPRNGGGVPWFWLALIIVVFIAFVAILMNRGRTKAHIEPNDPALRATGNRDDVNRRDDRIRRIG